MTGLDTLKREMFAYNLGDPKRTQHLIKVHSISSLIARMEPLPENMQIQVEALALVHDIGARDAMKKYGDSFLAHHERLGAPEADAMLRRVGGFPEPMMQRICEVVGKHHHVDQIDGIDFQILAEADFMVNAYEKSMSDAAIGNFYDRFCRTESGRALMREMFALDNI